MSELNYVPSWLDSAMTLLEKLNKCIEKIETIVNTVVSVTKTANDALNLAKTNESDVTAIQGDVTAIQGDVNRLDNIIVSTRELTDQALSTANRAETKADEATAKANTNATNITALQNEKSGKLYLHEIFLNTNSYELKFFSITEESKKYSDKIKNGETFSTILIPFNCVLSKVGDVFISKSLTLQLTDISLTNAACNGTINFAAYLNDNNQIVTITNYPEWYSATITGESVTEL